MLKSRMGTWKCRSGQNHYNSVYLVGSNVTGRIKERVARSRRAPAGLLAIVDLAVARTASFGGVADVIRNIYG